MGHLDNCQRLGQNPNTDDFREVALYTLNLMYKTNTMRNYRDTLELEIEYKKAELSVRIKTIDPKATVDFIKNQVNLELNIDIDKLGRMESEISQNEKEYAGLSAFLSHIKFTLEYDLETKKVAQDNDLQIKP